MGIVGLNKHTYETRYKILDMNVLEKENLTKHEVHLKIDNLNVEDMFDRNRTEELLDIFRSVDKRRRSGRSLGVQRGLSIHTDTGRTNHTVFIGESCGKTPPICT